MQDVDATLWVKTTSIKSERDVQKKEGNVHKLHDVAPR